MALSSWLIIRGIVGLIIGLVSFTWPGLTIAVLVAIFGLFALIDGFTNIVLGLTHTPEHGRSWAHLLQGLVGVAAGIVTFVWPGITTLALIWVIAAWAIITGVLEIIAAVRLRRIVPGEWMLALAGILSLIFGFLVFAYPTAGAVGIAWVLGVYAGLAGIVLIVLGIRLRSRAGIVAT
jgi:uncharacterized membrane protein HdeD (DUF308 family)